MNQNDLARITRWAATTRTWCRKSAALLYAAGTEATNESQRFVVSYEAENLLASILSDAELIAAVIDPERVDDCERRAKELLRLLRTRRLSAALERGEGRTPEERALFEAKARELRG